MGHTLGQPAEYADLSLRVEIAEPLGTESLIYTRLAGQDVQAKLYGTRLVHPGEEMTFRLALDSAHLFDAETGLSLMREGA